MQWLLAIVLTVISTIAYEPWKFENTSGDTISSRYWPVSLLKHRTYTLDPFKQDLEGVLYSAIYGGDGRWLPRHGFGMAVVSVPFYKLADMTDLGGQEWTHERINQMSRWNGILLSVLSVVMMFFLLCRFVPMEAAFLSSAVFALGTWNYSLGAQGLSSQNAAVIVAIACMYCLWQLCERQSRASHVSMGFLMGALHALMWSIRPQDILLIAPMILVVWARRVLMPYLATMVPLVLAVTMANLGVYNYYTGFYGVISGSNAGVPIIQVNFLKGMLGVLFSPNRGAITFFPLLFLLPLFWSSGRREKIVTKIRELISHALALAKRARGSVGRESFFLVLLMGFWTYFTYIWTVPFWHTTWSYGSRYLYDMQPIIWPFFAFGFAALVRRWKGELDAISRPLAAALILFSLQGVFVHWLGHRNYDLYTWNAKAHVDDARCWDITDPMLLEVWKAGSNDKRWNSVLERLKTYGF